MDEKEPYPALLGIDWALKKNDIFILKAEALFI